MSIGRGPKTIVLSFNLNHPQRPDHVHRLRAVPVKMEGMGGSCSTNFHMETTTTRSYTVPSTAGLPRFVVLRIEATAEVICVAGSEEYQVPSVPHKCAIIFCPYDEDRGASRGGNAEKG
ncbi:hypothetical protein MUK42_27482 [Musa troglodytarum]|uniref:Uncharacterized protein n=1 Tax=Musa troglodytarum TaxID=320322 RepID=A0A9E7JRJ8_9LILI|nr:hypothetical protein MUK42_27482 [Musa troglodytarum]